MSDLELICLTDVPPQEVDWLWYPYIAFGKITIVQGDPGEGKTMIMLSVIARLTKGECLYEQPFPNPPSVCIYQTAEDGLADTIVPRLKRMDADLSKVFVINESKQQLSFVDSRIEDAIRTTGARILILDPLQAYLGAGLDMHRANEVRPAMHFLSDVAERTGCAIVLIGHMNKTKGISSLYRGLGSIDIAGAARSICLVRQPDKESGETYFAQVKSNLAPMGKTLQFTRTDDSVEYEGVSSLSAEDLLRSGGRDEEDDSGGSTKVMQAINLITDLAQQCDEIPSADVFNLCEQRGISKRSLEAAKAELHLTSIHRGKVWYFNLRPLREEPFSSS